MIKQIAFTAYPVRDMKRARSFYEGDLGLKPASEMAGGSFMVDRAFAQPNDYLTRVQTTTFRTRRWSLPSHSDTSNYCSSCNNNSRPRSRA